MGGSLKAWKICSSTLLLLVAGCTSYSVTDAPNKPVHQKPLSFVSFYQEQDQPKLLSANDAQVSGTNNHFAQDLKPFFDNIHVVPAVKKLDNGGYTPDFGQHLINYGIEHSLLGQAFGSVESSSAPEDNLEGQTIVSTDSVQQYSNKPVRFASSGFDDVSSEQGVREDDTSYLTHKKKKKGEVHYHQHKHLHEHEHDQEHMHKHVGDHNHNHGHGHQHSSAHSHEHAGKHAHAHKAEHAHQHQGNHHHQHNAQHGHEHKSEHKHGHNHGDKHEHHGDHSHDHKHDGSHSHDHHEQGKHSHGHKHKHEGHHSHDHHGNDKHSHSHKHSDHHSHGHHGQHTHSHGHKKAYKHH